MDLGLGNDCHFQPLCLVDKRHRCLASQNLFRKSVEKYGSCWGVRPQVQGLKLLRKNINI